MISNGSVEVLCTGVRYELERELWQLVDGIGCENRQLYSLAADQYSSYQV